MLRKWLQSSTSPNTPGDPALYDAQIDQLEGLLRELRGRLREINPPVLQHHHQHIADELAELTEQSEKLLRRLRGVTRARW